MVVVTTHSSKKELVYALVSFVVAKFNNEYFEMYFINCLGAYMLLTK